MSKIYRNLSTEKGKNFWDSVEKTCEEVLTWPEWKQKATQDSIRLEHVEEDNEDYSFWP